MLIMKSDNAKCVHVGLGVCIMGFVSVVRSVLTNTFCYLVLFIIVISGHEKCARTHTHAHTQTRSKGEI